MNGLLCPEGDSVLSFLDEMDLADNVGRRSRFANHSTGQELINESICLRAKDTGNIIGLCMICLCTLPESERDFVAAVFTAIIFVLRDGFFVFGVHSVNESSLSWVLRLNLYVLERV